MRFHTDPSLQYSDLSAAATPFLSWVKTILTAEKYANLLSMFTYPIDTVRLTDEVFSALEKVFDGRDPIKNFVFSNPDINEDWDNYKANVLCDPEDWKAQSMEAMKGAINSFLVVDLPKEQITERPAPYSYFVNISDVYDYELSANGKEVEWIMFWIDSKRGIDQRIAVYDDETYKVVKLGRERDYTIEVESPHDLGYCPAYQFWDEPMSFKTPELKKSPITTNLGLLDWILFFELSKKYGDLYSPWAIYWGFMKDCDFSNESAKYECDGGFLKSFEGAYLFELSGSLKKCPRCKERINGVGSFIEVPLPKGDEKALTPPVGKIDVDAASLKYNVEELGRLKSEFYSSITGSNFETISNQAVNEKQVMSLFESRKQVLLNLKKNFEKAESWKDRTICLLRYGKGVFVSLSNNYGTDFYLGDSDQILEMYKVCRKDGLDHTILDMLQDQYYGTKYKANPSELQRVKIVTDLDPFRHITRTEIIAIKYDVDPEDYTLKMNFSTYLRKFEREQGGLIEFGANLDYNKKIERIKEVLKGYVANQAKQIVKPKEPIIE